jgi:glucose-6-phosphate-specific signal transduction histidine kinase
MFSKLRPQIMIAIIALSVLCGLSMVVHGGEMKEIAIAAVTGIILLAREVITQDTE